ncbi:MAG: secretin N-terminal domain-containing protein, partial [Comamonadaceae bacterium]|nr:secretin N-terminal domain-containing protein [Comamonadaceae bacterium]
AAGGRAPAAGAAGQTAGRAPAGAAQGAAGLGVGGSALGEGSPLFGALRVMPIERLNAVLVVTPRAAYLDEVRYWIEQFDRPNLNSAEPQLFVYKVKNGSADHLAELLNGIYGGVMAGPSATGATGVAPGLNTAVGATTGGAAGALRGGARGLGASMGAGGFGGLSSGVGGLNSGGAGLLGGAAAGQASVAGSGAGAQPAQSGPAVTTVTLGQSVRVMADRINNTLLIHATPAEYGRIEATLKRLDIQRAQVLIEASIIEVALRDGLEYGLQWAFKNGVGSRNGLGVLNNGSGSAVAGAAIDAAGAITNAAQGFSYTLTGAAGNLSAMLNALATKSLVKVISSPSLMVLDNHSASIVVGDQQPINVGTTISSTGTIATTNNIQYKDTGVMLNVTPSVNAGDLVTLDINQTVTDVGLKDDVTNQRSFLQRQINSKVAVRSGETLVLGGLIKDNQDNGKSGLPGLSSIPVLGALFGKHNQSSARTELLVVLTPRVLRSDEDARA